MSIRKLTVFLLLLSFIPIFSHAQSLQHSEGTSHWEGGMNVGLNTDGYEIGFRGIYFPVQYVGIKIGLSFAGEIREIADWYWFDPDYDYDYGYDPDDDYTIRFKFNPAIVLRSPRLINIKSQDAGLYIFAEPGFVLSPGATGSRHASYSSLDLKTGFNLQIDRIIFTLGYGISDFSLYSGAPISHNGLPVDTEYITHTIFIGCSYKF